MYKKNKKLTKNVRLYKENLVKVKNLLAILYNVDNIFVNDNCDNKNGQLFIFPHCCQPFKKSVSRC